MKKKFSSLGRYKSEGNVFPEIILTGNVYLKYQDEEAISAAAKGDIMLYLDSDGKAYPQDKGDYVSLGRAGYFKGSVYSGKEWLPLNVQEAFPSREHQFGKREAPMDVYIICADILRAKAGAALIRTYREHYSFKEE